MVIKSKEAIKKKIASKEARLNKVLSTPEPIVSSLYEAHIRRQINSINFLDELDEVKVVLNFDNNVKLVSLNEFNSLLVSADASNIEFDGEFCKLALLQNVNLPSEWLLYVAPIESI